MDTKKNDSGALSSLKEEAAVLKGEKSKDRFYSSERDLGDEASARAQFDVSKKKLFDVNGWANMSGITNSKFELYTPEGRPLKTDRVRKDDFIKIDLPGPLPFYWVKVTEVSEEADSAQFVVQPTYDPTEADDKRVTDHFFQDRARSTFRIERTGTKIVAMEIGTDEAINNRKGEAGEKGLINTLVSEGGWAAFQRYQWKNLTDYLAGLE